MPSDHDEVVLGILMDLIDVSDVVAAKSHHKIRADSNFLAIGILHETTATKA